MHNVPSREALRGVDGKVESLRDRRPEVAGGDSLVAVSSVLMTSVSWQ